MCEAAVVQSLPVCGSLSPMDKAPDFWSGDCRFESCQVWVLSPPPIGWNGEAISGKDYFQCKTRHIFQARSRFPSTHLWTALSHTPKLCNHQKKDNTKKFQLKLKWRIKNAAASWLWVCGKCQRPSQRVNYLNMRHNIFHLWEFSKWFKHHQRQNGPQDQFSSIVIEVVVSFHHIFNKVVLRN